MAAPLFSVNPQRYDPYRTFKFQILIGGVVVAGLSKMTALKKTTEVVEWRYAGDNSQMRKVPGGTSYEPISLEAGLTHDPTFMLMANRVNNFDGDGAMSLAGFRTDLIINVLNLQGQIALSYQVRKAWVSEFQALPDLDANSMNAVGIQMIKLEHEGWSQNLVIPEPLET